ncbi:MAG TPA: hypothetical protein PLH01_04500 [Kiritimatiellia bacterium]|nr:hypothetical protein [Kiritimatiellia bacterium]
MGCFEKRKDHEAVTGVRLEIMTAPETITPEALAEGLRQQPPIPKYRPCNFEVCAMACPYTRSQGTEDGESMGKDSGLCAGDRGRGVGVCSN